MKVLYYIQIGMGSILSISSGVNIALHSNLPTSDFVAYLILQAIISSYGIFNIRKGWRELNKIEEERRWKQVFKNL